MGRVLLILLICSCTLAASDIQQGLYSLYQALDALNATVRETPLEREMRQLRENPTSIALRNGRFADELESLLNITSRRTHYATKGVRDQATTEAYQRVLNRITTKPLICFYECTSDTCILSRHVNPSYRDMYEQRIVERILASQPDDGSPVVYTSVGSGWLLQDMRILALALHREPRLNIIIHSVDPVFEIHNLLGWNRIFTQENVTLGNIYHELQQRSDLQELGKKYNRSLLREHGGVAPLAKPRDMYQYEAKLPNHPNYMLHLLRSAYPNARISLYLFPGMEAHYNAVIGPAIPRRNFYLPYPHVIGCCDLDSPSILSQIHTFVANIMLLAQQQNQAPHTLYLMGYNRQDGAHFTEFFLPRMEFVDEYYEKNTPLPDIQKNGITYHPYDITGMEHKMTSVTTSPDRRPNPNDIITYADIQHLSQGK